MPIMRVTVTLNSATGLPEDASTNTFHFDATSESEAQRSNLLDLMEDLYALGSVEATALVGLMSNEATSGTGLVRVYNLDNPEPRFPIAEREIAGSASGAQMLPAEVSLCVSFQGSRVSGEPQARRRGRIYLPFLRENDNVEGRPAETLVDAIGAAFTEFGTAAAASISNDWVVYSRVDDAAVPIRNGWVDNAWDTQRRRGWAPTTRTSWGPA